MNAAKQKRYYAIVNEKNELFHLLDDPDKMQIYSNKRAALSDAAFWTREEVGLDDNFKYSVIEVSFGKKVKK